MTDFDPVVDDLYAVASEHKADLRLSVYITVQAIESCFRDPAGRRDAVAVLRSFGITKAYVESYRCGTVADEALLVDVRDYLRANGFDVAGGIAPAWGESAGTKSFGIHENSPLDWFNYEHPKTQVDLERVVRLTARVFDELIVDDMFCTSDTSELSNQARGDRSWAQYRMDLMTDLSERVVRGPAREENPVITLIIKFPQWYDRFHLHGYDVKREPAVFDKVWIGTETRGPDTAFMGYVKQYEGFVNFKWLSTCAPDQIGGAWFDHIDCDAHDFMDQAFQTVLAGAREIILFNYFDLMHGHPGHHRLRRSFSQLVRLAQMCRENPACGVLACKPPHSDAGNDHYIFDYLGMLGVPLLPVCTLPDAPGPIFLASHAASDPHLLAIIERRLAAAETVIITSGLLDRLSNQPKLFRLAGVEIQPARTQIHVNELLVLGKIVQFGRGLTVPFQLQATSATVLLAAMTADVEYPVLVVRNTDSGGRLVVLNLGTFGETDFDREKEVLLAPIAVPWLDLPEAWLNQIRACFLEPLGLGLTGPGRVSLHPFGESEWVLCNFNQRRVEVSLSVDRASGPDQMGLRDVFSDEAFLVERAGARIELGERSWRWLSRHS